VNLLIKNIKTHSVLSIIFIFSLSVFMGGNAAAEKPSIKDVLTDTGTHQEAGADISASELPQTGGLTVDELDDKIVIGWRGPKSGQLLETGIKKRGAEVREYHVFKSKNAKLNFVLCQKIKANSEGHYKYEDFDLQNDSVYYYKIMIADRENGLHEYIAQFRAMTRDINRPKRPRRPEVTSGDGFVKIMWQPYIADDFNEYQILRAEGVGGEPEVVARIKQSGICQLVDSEIINGKTYLYSIKIVDKAGNESRESDEVAGKPRDSSPPAAPQNLKSLPGNNSVTLTWQRPSDKDVEFHRIYMHEGELKPGAKMKCIATIAANDSFLNSFEVTKLKNGKIYIFDVTAVDFSGNESARSFEVKTSPVDFTPPKTPSYIKTVSMNAAMRIEWAQVPDFDNDLGGYRIYRKSTAFPKYIAVAEIRSPKAAAEQMFSSKKKKEREGATTGFYPTIYEYTDNGLYNGMPYYYYVVAFDKKGNESKPTEISDGIPRDKSAPKKVDGVTGVSHLKKIEIKWKKNKSDRDLLGYFIYRRAEGEDKYALIAEIKNLEKPSYSDEHLAMGVKYYYRVAAFDESRNESVASNETFATARFPNQISFSRAYMKNYPYTYCYSINLNGMSISYTKSQDNISWSSWSETLKLPSRPPNFGRMAQISVQKWTSGILIFCYNPETLDLYFTNTPDEKTFGTWQMLFNRIELPPNFGSNCHMSFEKDEKTIMAFAYNPKTSSAYYSFSRDLETFLRWNLCGLKVVPPPLDSDFTKYCITSDEKGFYLFSFDTETANVMQSFCFDKKHWKAWYNFAKNMKKPPNLEKSKVN